MFWPEILKDSEFTGQNSLKDSEFHLVIAVEILTSTVRILGDVSRNSDVVRPSVQSAHLERNYAAPAYDRGLACA